MSFRGSVLLFSVTVSAVLATHAGQIACSRLVSELGSRIVQTSNGSDYQSSIQVPVNLVNDGIPPACIVFPKCTSHVSIAMKAIYQANSTYAVLSGGHSALPGWDAVNGGVLIYFRDMNSTSYDAKTDTITLEPGIRWGEATAILAEFGVAPTGCRDADVGSGYLLGGGLSFLSSSMGFGADTMKEVDVVLVNGTVVTANAHNQYWDLFKALKGGGNRFGIVTRFELYPFHSGTANDKRWTGGSILYPNSSIEAVMKATAHYIRNVDDPKSIIFSTAFYVVESGVVTPVINLNIFYNGPSLPDHIFGEFLSIPYSNNSITAMSYADIGENTYPGPAAHGSTYIFGSSVLDGNDEQAFIDAIAYNLNFTETFKDNLASTGIAFTPISNSQVLAGRARGGNVMDPPRGGYASVFLVEFLLPGVAEVPQSIKDGKQLLLEQIKPAPGFPQFLNECDPSQNVFETYGQYEFLKRTYNKYDPTRFNVRFTAGPTGL